jgi:hypothetical protein
MATKTKKKSTKGTGQDQGGAGQARHDVATFLNDYLKSPGDAGRHDVASIAEALFPITGKQIANRGKAPIWNPLAQASSATPTKKKGGGGGGSTNLTNQQLEQQVQQYEQQQQAYSGITADTQGLVNTLNSEMAPLEKAMSGLDTGAAETSANNVALSAAGVPAGSSAAQWLNSETAQANANDTPMMQAMNAYANVVSAGQTTVDSALTNLGEANKIGIETASAAPWLSALGSHLQSNIAYSGQIPTSLAGGIPDWLKYYLSQSGGPAGGGSQESLSTLAAGLGGPGTGVPKQAGAGAALNLAGSTPTAAQTTIPSDTGSAPG